MIALSNLESLQPEKLEAIVFDLDGTLYEDETHFDYYAECLASEIPSEYEQNFFADLKAARQGNHTLRLGRVYDVNRDNILSINEKGRVLKAWDWQGNQLTESRCKEIYDRPVSCDLEEMIFMGDGWWLPAACAYHYGCTDTYNCYQKTKDWLAENQEEVLSRIPGLKEFLQQLRKNNFNLILATNSDARDTDRLLRLLGLNGIFHNRYTSCKKPEHSRELFATIIDKNKFEPEQFLSLGDNYLNDIAPAITLGYQAILIDPHNIYANPGVPRVSSLREIITDSWFKSKIF